MTEGFYEALMKRIRESLSELEKPCLDNSFKTFEEYKYQVGIIRGLNLAEDIARETFKSWMKGK